MRGRRAINVGGRDGSRWGACFRDMEDTALAGAFVYLMGGLEMSQGFKCGGGHGGMCDQCVKT